MAESADMGGLAGVGPLLSEGQAWGSWGGGGQGQAERLNPARLALPRGPPRPT